MRKNKTGVIIIFSAIIWSAVLIACAMVLKGTDFKEKINFIIAVGIMFHFLFIWLPLGNQLRKK